MLTVIQQNRRSLSPWTQRFLGSSKEETAQPTSVQKPALLGGGLIQRAISNSQFAAGITRRYAVKSMTDSPVAAEPSFNRTLPTYSMQRALPLAGNQIQDSGQELTEQSDDFSAEFQEHSDVDSFTATPSPQRSLDDAGVREPAVESSNISRSAPTSSLVAVIEERIQRAQQGLPPISDEDKGSDTVPATAGAQSGEEIQASAEPTPAQPRSLTELIEERISAAAQRRESTERAPNVGDRSTRRETTTDSLVTSREDAPIEEQTRRRADAQSPASLPPQVRKLMAYSSIEEMGSSLPQPPLPEQPLPITAHEQPDIPVQREPASSPIDADEPTNTLLGEADLSKRYSDTSDSVSTVEEDDAELSNVEGVPIEQPADAPSELRRTADPHSGDASGRITTADDLANVEGDSTSVAAQSEQTIRRQLDTYDDKHIEMDRQVDEPLAASKSVGPSLPILGEGHIEAEMPLAADEAMDASSESSIERDFVPAVQPGISRADASDSQDDPYVASHNVQPPDAEQPDTVTSSQTDDTNETASSQNDNVTTPNENATLMQPASSDNASNSAEAVREAVTINKDVQADSTDLLSDATTSPDELSGDAKSVGKEGDNALLHPPVSPLHETLHGLIQPDPQPSEETGVGAAIEDSDDKLSTLSMLDGGPNENAHPFRVGESSVDDLQNDDPEAKPGDSPTELTNLEGMIPDDAAASHETGEYAPDNLSTYGAQSLLSRQANLPTTASTSDFEDDNNAGLQKSNLPISEHPGWSESVGREPDSGSSSNRGTNPSNATVQRMPQRLGNRLDTPLILAKRQLPFSSAQTQSRSEQFSIEDGHETLAHMQVGNQNDAARIDQQQNRAINLFDAIGISEGMPGLPPALRSGIQRQLSKHHTNVHPTDVKQLHQPMTAHHSPVNVPATLIQRQALSQVTEIRMQPAASPDSGQSKAAPNLDQLARQLLPFIKRILTVERERGVHIFF